MRRRAMVALKDGFVALTAVRVRVTAAFLPTDPWHRDVLQGVGPG